MRAKHYRAREMGLQQRQVSWWAWVLVAGGVVAAVPTLGQSGAGQGPSSVVPEAVLPRNGSPTIPQGNDGSSMPVPRSENPQVNGSGRPVPDRGVIVPPVSGMGTTPVIPPPVVGSMPIIPPPGRPGGEKGVVPK